MTIWQPELSGRTGPKYRRIVDAIGQGIADGSLGAGTRLPTQRDLAYRLGISLNTVSRAYAEAVRRGYLEGEVGRGTFVRAVDPLAETGAPAGLSRPVHGPIDFTLNLPAVGESHRALAETLGDLRKATDLAALLDYQDEGGSELRGEAAAAWIGRLGLKASPERVIQTNGAQHGLLVALMALTRPGDVLLTEALTYAPIKPLARQLGLKLQPVDLDAQGLVPESLDAACRNTSARTLYCLPTLHTPTTATMPASRRQSIAELARTHRLTIVEDDVFGFLPTDRPPPLAHFAPERCLLLTSLSKCLAPGLRVGLLHAPDALCGDLRNAVKLTSWMPPPLMGEIAGRWIEDGTADRLNRFQREEAAARQSLAKRLLAASDTRAHPDGFHLWLGLPETWPAERFRAEAARRGVRVLTAETFAVHPARAPNAVRLCLSHESSRARVARGLEILSEILSETGDSEALVL